MTGTRLEGVEHELALRLDGESRTATVHAADTLLDTLRHSFGVTSTRGTCGIGICGTCTVLLDGKAVSSCLKLAVSAAGHDVTTAGGLRGPAGELSQVQEAFIRHGAYQCSFCIPAMTVAVQAALDDPEVGNDVESIREALAGNLCRCGTYPQILQAVAELVAGDPDHNQAGELTDGNR